MAQLRFSIERKMVAKGVAKIDVFIFQDDL